MLSPVKDMEEDVKVAFQSASWRRTCCIGQSPRLAHHHDGDIQAFIDIASKSPALTHGTGMSVDALLLPLSLPQVLYTSHRLRVVHMNLPISTHSKPRILESHRHHGRETGYVTVFQVPK